MLGFKRTIGTYQHAVMAKFRAVETRKSVFRSANTGISLVVSPKGSIKQHLELFHRDILTDTLEIHPQETVYTLWGYLFPLISFCLLVILFFLLFGKIYIY